MAITKKAAKKAVPKVVEEPKQIVLTQDQYDELTGLKWDINNVSNELKNITTDENKNVREIAFEFGVLQVKLEKVYDDLTKITDAVDPDPYVWEDEDAGQRFELDGLGRSYLGRFFLSLLVVRPVRALLPKEQPE